MRCNRFERFKRYISGREASLKRTFKRLDVDGDGHLTADEVEAGLANFGFTCPFSRCVYRTKGQVGPSIWPSPHSTPCLWQTCAIVPMPIPFSQLRVLRNSFGKVWQLPHVSKESAQRAVRAVQQLVCMRQGSSGTAPASCLLPFLLQSKLSQRAPPKVPASLCLSLAAAPAHAARGHWPGQHRPGQHCAASGSRVLAAMSAASLVILARSQRAQPASCQSQAVQQLLCKLQNSSGPGSPGLGAVGAARPGRAA
jgi:hypothetical protein